MRAEPHRLIFVDECGTKTNMTRARGCARRGQRVRDHAPFRHAGTQTFVAGLRTDCLAAPSALDGPINRAAFEAWIETQLAPTLQKGDVVILDNLAVHKSPKAAATLRAKGAGSCFCALLPLSQPDRDGLRQAQGAPAPHRRPHPRRALARGRRDSRPLPPRQALEFFRKAGYVSD